MSNFLRRRAILRRGPETTSGGRSRARSHRAVLYGSMGNKQSQPRADVRPQQRRDCCGRAPRRRDRYYEEFDDYTPRVRVRPAQQQWRSAPGTRTSPSSVSDEQVSQVVGFTGADPDVCRRVIADFRGDAQAAAESLLLSGGREVMCFTLPDGAFPGQAVRVQVLRTPPTLPPTHIRHHPRPPTSPTSPPPPYPAFRPPPSLAPSACLQTPRGMVEVTVPEGLRGGDNLTFNLPSPTSKPTVAVARPVSGLPSPAQLPPPSAAEGRGGADRAADGVADKFADPAPSVPVSDYPQAVAMPPTEPSHTMVIVHDHYPMARPYCEQYHATLSLRTKPAKPRAPCRKFRRAS